MLSTFLAVGLSGRAHAEAPEETLPELPDPPAVEIVEEAAEGDIPVLGTEDEIPAAGETTIADDSSFDSQQDISEETAPSHDDPMVADDTPAPNVSAEDAPELPSDNAPEGDVPLTSLPAADTNAVFALSSAESAPLSSVTGTSDEENVFSPDPAVSSFAPLAEDVSVLEAPLSAPGDVSGSEDDESAGDSVFLELEEGTYVLINYDDDSKSIVSDNELVILAAGLNHVNEIASAVMSKIGGTGILLVDKLTGPLSLMTLDDLYSEGSVAVFTQQENGDYLLINGDVPGILDEKYEIQGYNLIVPAFSRLILSAIGGEMDPETGNVTYYINGNEYEPVSQENCVESAGSLVIGDGASLVIEEDGLLSMNSMNSAVSDNKIAPLLEVNGSGTLQVDGAIEGDGKIVLDGEADSLSGEGKISGHDIHVSSPGVISGSGTTFSAEGLLIYGSGTLSSLRLENAQVHCLGNVDIGMLSSAGVSPVIFHAASTILDIVCGGTVHLRTSRFFSEYSDDMAVALAGEISGSGTLVLESGIYTITDTASLSEKTGVQYGYPLVYDYKGLLPTDKAPLVMQPGSAPTAQNNSVNVVTAFFEEAEHADYIIISTAASAKTTEQIADLPPIESSFPLTVSGGSAVIDLSELKNRVDDMRSSDDSLQPMNVIVELMRKSADGTLSTDFYNYDSSVNELVGTVDGSNIYLIRIDFYSSLWPPYGGGTVSSTSTSFTGSGILGGAGAGSVRYGSTTYVLRDGEANSSPAHAANSAETKETPVGDLRVIVSKKDDRIWIARAFSGTREIMDLLGQAVSARISLLLPDDWNDGSVFAVFISNDGSLAAFRSVYDPIRGEISFDTDLLGEFILVSFDYSGVLFSDDFYAALSMLPEVQQFLRP